MNRSNSILLIFTALLVTNTHALAQNLSVGEETKNREVLMMGLYPPDIIMRQQQRLGITDEQRSKIAGIVRGFQSEVTDLQWEMPGEQQKLKEMLKSSPISAPDTLQQVTRVLEMESEFKLSHFRLLIAIKNTLTTEQITQLDRAIRQRLKKAGA